MSNDTRSKNRKSIGPSSDRIQRYADDIHLMYDDVEFSLEQLTRYGEPVVFKGAPGIGKTTSLFNVAYNKNEPVTYLAARHDMYESAKQKALEAGFEPDEFTIVPSPFEECPTFMGAHGDDIQAEYKSLYNMGIGGTYPHESDLIPSPCHTDTTTCRYMTQRVEDPDDYKVIIGHYKHALNKELIEGRLTFVDEFAEDDSITTLTKTGLEDDNHLRIGRALDGYFSYADFLSVDSFDQFIGRLSAGRINNPEVLAVDIFNHPDGSGRGLVFDEKELLDMDPDQRFHKKAPSIIFGLLMAEDLENGWHSWTLSPNFPLELENLSEGFAVARNDPNNYDNLEVYMLEPTDLSAASQVIGLDGTARKTMWDTIFEQDFAIEEFITTDQMGTYVEDIQKMSLWKSTDAARPYSSGTDVYPDQDAAAILYTALEVGKPVVITTKKAVSTLKSEIPKVFEEDVKPVEVTTSKSTTIKDAMNFAMIRSNNEAAGTDAIYIAGSFHPGDDVFQRWGALMSVGVERVDGTQGTEVRYTPKEVGQEIYGHFVLDKTEQAIMRGRRGDGDDEGSTVVVGTGCRPEWAMDVNVYLDIEEESPFTTENRRVLMRYLSEMGQATSTQLREETGFSRPGLHHAMSPLLEEDLVSDETQDGHPTIYTWIGPI